MNLVISRSLDTRGFDGCSCVLRVLYRVLYEDSSCDLNVYLLRAEADSIYKFQGQEAFAALAVNTIKHYELFYVQRQILQRLICQRINEIAINLYRCLFNSHSILIISCSFLTVSIQVFIQNPVKIYIRFPPQLKMVFLQFVTKGLRYPATHERNAAKP